MQKRHKSESGVTLAEVMVAIVIIAILLIASAAAFAGSVGASVSTGNRNQAVQISQDLISVAKSVAFYDLATVPPAVSGSNPSQCSAGWTGTYNGKAIIARATKFEKLNYCQITEIPGTGMVYAAYVYVTKVQTADFDATSVAVPTTSTRFVPRRVTIKIIWFDKLQTTGGVTYQQVIQSYIRSPTIADCIPNNNYKTGSPIPPGCV